MILADPAELLDLQIEFLYKHDGVPFLAQLARYLDAITSDPRVRTLFEDLLEEAEQAERNFAKVERDLMARLCIVRDKVIAADPTTDDSALVQNHNIGHDAAYEVSFARFNAIVERARDRIMLARKPDKVETWFDYLVMILRHKLKKGDALLSEVADVSARHDFAFREFGLLGRSEACAAAARLRSFVDEMNPPPASTDEERFVWHARIGMNDVLKALHDLPGTYAEGPIKLAASELRADAERVHVELRRRVYSRRSRRALLERFKIRCESYDRDRLRELAVPNKRETPLTVEAARFLFDNGLTPLIDATSGGLRPDLLDTSTPWTFYLESKQYGDAAGARKSVRDGAKQIWDTAGHLKSLGVGEVFWLVFRRGGPRCILPDEIRAEGLVVYPILIDIADTKESGSQQTERPLEFKAEDLSPIAVGATEAADKETKNGT